MAIQYPEILDLKTTGVDHSWTDHEVMLYALGIGMGRDPLDEKELPFVYERNLRVMPTFLTVVAREGVPRPNINNALVLDGEREIVIHRPLETSADVIMDGRIVGVADKGPGKGAIVTREVVIKKGPTGEKIATMISSIFARGDGGFGGPSESPKPKVIRPEGPPDRTVDFATRRDQALLYRLSGDRNPLHCDPQFAAKAGFDRPILHGLCTYGLCCRAILQTYADYDPTAIRRFAARFSAPCFPGEIVSVDLWKRGSTLFFEARVASQNRTVIRNGQAHLA